MHSICYLRFFCSWIDGRDHFKKSRTKLGAKSIYGPNQEITQNVGTKSVFTHIYIYIYIAGSYEMYYSTL